MQQTTEEVFNVSKSKSAEESTVKILMAEDNMVNQKLANLLFKKMNHQIDIVSNGRQAVDAVLKGSYDLVFMDIQMPLMDGVEASREIKSKLGEKSPVIVALTANAMHGDKEKYLNAGMDHYIPKPLSMQDLSSYIQQYVSP